MTRLIVCMEGKYVVTVGSICFEFQVTYHFCFLASSQNFENRLLASSCLSVYLSVCLSVCLSFRMEQFRSHWTNFH
jgi:hypothetical protein